MGSPQGLPGSPWGEPTGEGKGPGESNYLSNLNILNNLNNLNPVRDCLKKLLGASRLAPNSFFSDSLAQDLNCLNYSN